MASKGLYANIAAKKKRIAAGSGEKMRSPALKALHLLRHLSRQLRPRRKSNVAQAESN